MSSGAYALYIDQQAGRWRGWGREASGTASTSGTFRGGGSRSLPLFFRSHMTTLGRLARLPQSLPR